MKPRTDPRARYCDDDPPRDPWSERRQIVIGVVLLALIAAGIGFPIARVKRFSRDCTAVLDARIAALQEDISAGASARARHDAILADIAAEQSAREALASRMPCDLGLGELVPALRGRLEPLGVVLRPELGFKQRREDHEEASIPLELPDREGAEAEARAAAAATGRLFLWRPGSGGPRSRVVVALAYPCDPAKPALDARSGPIAFRDRVFWPFDGDVLRREQEIARLRQEREKDAEALQDELLLARLREERRRLEALLESFASRPDAVPPAPASP